MKKFSIAFWLLLLVVFLIAYQFNGWQMLVGVGIGLLLVKFKVQPRPKTVKIGYARYFNNDAYAAPEHTDYKPPSEIRIQCG